MITLHEKAEYHRSYLTHLRKRIKEVEKEHEAEKTKERQGREALKAQEQEAQESSKHGETSLLYSEKLIEKIKTLEIPSLKTALRPKINFKFNIETEKPSPATLPAEVPFFSIEFKPLIDIRASSEISEKLETASLALQVPSLSPLMLPSLKPTIVEELPMKLEPEKASIEAVPGQYVKASEAAIEAEEYILQQLEDFIDKITFGLAGWTGMNRPLLIITEKPSQGSHVYYIALICRELYRILSRKGKPTPRWIVMSQYQEEPYKAEFELFTQAENRVYILEDVKLSDIKSGPLYDRLRELYSEDLGFIIIQSDEAEKIINFLVQEVRDYAIPEIKSDYTSPPPLSQENWLKLASLMWSYVDQPVNSIDEAIGIAEKLYYERLKRIYNNTELKLWIKFDENEGFEHRALKMKIVEIIARKLGAKNTAEIVKLLEKECIKTEQPIPLKNNQQSNQKPPKADVYLQAAKCKEIREDVYIEIETLYGTGDPIEKIRQTLDKYLENGQSRVRGKIAIVTIGLHTILFLKQLTTLKKHYTKQGLNVEFYTVNLAENKLVPLRDILKLLLQIKKEVNKMQS